MLNGLPIELSDSYQDRGILSRFKDWISKFVEVEEDDEDGITNGNKPNKEKLKQTLQQCIHYFDCLFQSCTDNSSEERAELDTSLNDSFMSPERNYSALPQRTNSKASLSDNIMNNSQNLLKIQYMGDPVIRAIQPHENKFICRNLHRLSQYLNRTYSPQLMYVSKNEDFLISRVSRLFLNERPPPSPFEQSTQDECELPRFRINLRPLASYHILILLFLGTTVPYLVGITSFKFILFSIFPLIIFISILLISN